MSILIGGSEIQRGRDAHTDTDTHTTIMMSTAGDGLV